MNTEIKNGVKAKVWFTDCERQDGRPTPFQVIETSFISFRALSDAIGRDEFITCNSLWTQRTEGAAILITGRSGLSFRGSSVSRVVESDREFVEGMREGV